MWQRARAILFTIASVTILALSSPSAPDSNRAMRAQDDERTLARAWLEKVAAGLEGVAFLRAKYTQTQHLATLLKPRVTKGRLFFRRDPACLLLHVAPEGELRIRMDETSHRVYRPKDKRAERYLFETNHLNRALMRCFTSEIRELEKTFEIRAFRALEDTIEIDLAPRDEKARTFLRLLTLRIRATDAAIVSIAYVDAGGDEVRIDLSSVEKAPKPEEVRALFDAELPDDVRLFERTVPSR